MKQKIKYYLDWLGKKNYKSFYLAILRVVISLWLLKEVLINWDSMDILYGDDAFVVPAPRLINMLPGGDISLVRNHYIWYISGYIAVLFMNLLGIGRWITAVLLLLMVYSLQTINGQYFNGGDMMARLILFYLIFADSYQYFVIKKQQPVNLSNQKAQNLLSNLAAFSIMLQLCLAYFASAIGKLSNDLWLDGEAIYYALSSERFMGLQVNREIVQVKWLDIVLNYAVLIIELVFPILVWVKKLRKPLLVAGILLHLSFYIFMMIYGFQLIFMMMYGLFLPNDKLLEFAQKIKSLLRKIKCPKSKSVKA